MGVVLEDQGEMRVRVGETTMPLPLGPGAAAQTIETGDVVRIRWREDPRSSDLVVVAKAGTAAAQLHALALSHDLAPLFSAEIDAEVQSFVAAPGLEEPDLVPLEDKPFVTIDNEDSRDLDQALCIEHDDATGHHLVWYALADAAFYCPTGSAMFERALQQGASFYLPGLVLPMLPPSMSEGLISLNPGVLRRALVFRMELDGHGECVATTVQRGRIRSRAKLSYGGVQRYHDALEAGNERHDALHHGHDYSPTLRWLRTVGEMRLERASERDVVSFRRTEVQVQLDAGNRRGFSLVSDERHEVERWNEQVSLLCNMEGARWLRQAIDEGRGRNVQAIFRTHAAPSPQRMQGLCDLIGALVALYGLPDTWRWRPAAESLARFLSRLPHEGEEGRIALAIHRQAMVLSQRSVFEVRPSPHHGVGAEVYARFSAPMREVVGIFTHKEALELLEGRGDMEISGDDLALQTAIVTAANRAKETQAKLTKEANLLGIQALLEDDLGTLPALRRWRRGTVLGVSPSKVYVQLDAPSVELKVYLNPNRRSLRCDDREVCLWEEDTPLCRLGDDVEVSVRGYDDRRHRWELALRPTSVEPQDAPSWSLP